MNRDFVLLFENITGRAVHIGYCFPKVEIKEYKVMIKKRHKNIQEYWKNCRWPRR